MKSIIPSLLACACACGCVRTVSLSRTPDGYTVKYRNIGLKTDVSRIEVERQTNGYIRVMIDGVQTDLSSNAAPLVESSGTAVGNVAQKVVDGIKGFETIKTSN